MNEVIKSENWDKLKRISSPRYFLDNYKNITFTRSFFDNFFLDPENFKDFFREYVTGENKVVAECISKFTAIAVEMGFTDTKFWEKYINLFIREDVKFYIHLSTTYPTGEIFNWNDKNADFVRILFKSPPIVKEKMMQSNFHNVFPRKIYTELSDDERAKFPKVFWAPEEMQMENPPQLLDILGSVEAVIEFCRVHDNIRTGDVFRDLSQERIESIVMEMFDKPTEMWMVKNTLRWFKNNPGAKVSGDFIQKIKFGMVFRTDDILGNLTKEQIIDNFSYVHIPDLVLSGFPLGDIPRGFHPLDITKVRFYTDEEISDNAELFRPESINLSGHLYVSQKTFRKVCEATGINKRYNKNLMNFNLILQKLKFHDSFTMENFFYLVEKCEPTKSEILSAINYVPGLNVLRVLGDFMEKFRGNR